MDQIPVRVSALEEGSIPLGMVNCWQRSLTGTSTSTSSSFVSGISTSKRLPRRLKRPPSPGRPHWLLPRGLVNGLLRGLTFGLAVTTKISVFCLFFFCMILSVYTLRLPDMPLEPLIRRGEAHLRRSSCRWDEGYSTVWSRWQLTPSSIELNPNRLVIR